MAYINAGLRQRVEAEVSVCDIGFIPADGVSAKFCYDSAHPSTGFQPYKRKSLELSSNLEVIADVRPPGYRKPCKHRIDGMSVSRMRSARANPCARPGGCRAR